MSDFEMPKKEEVSKDVDNTTKTDEKEKPKYSADELIRVFDDIIFAGVYTEIVELRGGKLKIGFKTRSAEEVEAITRVLDTTQANLMATLNEKRGLLNLQYSLIAYQGRDLAGMKLEERASFINKLPAPVVGALMIALSKFDEKVYLACKEGEENF